jgi:hypothetical protein
MKKIIFLFCLLLSETLSNAQWEPDVRMTNDPSRSLTTYNNARCVAAGGDNVHIVWYDNRDGNMEIYYKRSTDGGSTWGEDTRLTNDPADSKYPALTVSGSVVHVAWCDWRFGGAPEILYNRSEDGGSTWGGDVRLTNASGNSFCPSVTASGSVVHIVWYDNRNGHYEIFYKHSTDGGLTWGPDTQLTNSNNCFYPPSISVSGLVVHVVWEDNRDGDYEVFYKRSEDGGLTWGQDVQQTNTSALSWWPSVSGTDSLVYMVWQDKREGNREIYYKRSADGGLNWGDDTRLTNSSGDSKYPNISVSGPVVHIVWCDNRDGDEEIYYNRSADNGLSWGEDTRLTNSSGNSENPGVALSGPVVHVVWFDLRDGNEEIYYKRDTTGGFTVGTGNDLAGSPGHGFSIFPNPASNAVHITVAKYSITITVISIKNILGEEVLRTQIRNGESSINVSNLQNGFYSATLIAKENQYSSIKLIIAR